MASNKELLSNVIGVLNESLGLDKEKEQEQTLVHGIATNIIVLVQAALASEAAASEAVRASEAAASEAAVGRYVFKTSKSAPRVAAAPGVVSAPRVASAPRMSAAMVRKDGKPLSNYMRFVSVLTLALKGDVRFAETRVTVYKTRVAPSKCIELRQTLVDGSQIDWDVPVRLVDLLVEVRKFASDRMQLCGLFWLIFTDESREALCCSAV